MKQYDKFVSDVLAGKGHHCKKIIQLCEQYEANKLRDDIWFDEKEVDKHLNFIKKLPLATDEFAGKIINLLDWQAFLVANMYGWFKEVEDPDGNKTIVRKNKTIYLQVPRKNTKTSTAGILSIDNSVIDISRGSDVIFAATSRNQANICFDMACDICLEASKISKTFSDSVKIWAGSIEFTGLGTFMKPVSAEAKTIEGEGAKFAVIDEVHLHDNWKVIRSVQKGMVKHNNPLIMLITTAGYNKSEEAPAFQMYNHSANVLDGSITDDSLFPMIFEPDKSDDWNDENTWRKANPTIGITPKWHQIRSEYETAKSLGGSAEVDFKIKHLNMWVDSAVTWISGDKWNEGQHDFPDLTGLPGYGGLDLASVLDMCSLCINIPYKGENYFIWKYYLPEAALNNNKNPMVAQYRDWANKGYLTITSGDATDYNYIKRDAILMYEKYNLRGILYDRYNSSQLVIELGDEGLNMIPMGQGWTSMSTPTKEFQAMVMHNQIQHGNNPVTNWQLGNVRITRNENDDIKVSKKASNYKVDGIVAAIMALEGENILKNINTSKPNVWII